jgi:transposase
VLFYCVFQGLTDSTIFEDFIEQLLQHCGRWLELKSVLVMDNALFYYSEGVKELCVRAGVKLVFLLLYSLDLNLIEEFFRDLKRFIRRNWGEYKSNPA